MALTGVKNRPVSSSPKSRAKRVLAQCRVCSWSISSALFPIPILPNISGRYPSFPATYTRRPEVKVVAFSAPKQDAETIKARIREPIGPKTLLPNMTATVLELLMTFKGRTKMYAMLARMYDNITRGIAVWMTLGRSRVGFRNSPTT